MCKAEASFSFLVSPFLPKKPCPNIQTNIQNSQSYHFLRKTHLKTVKEIKKTFNPFKKISDTFCYRILTCIIEKSIHRISYLKHFVFAKTVADLQISREFFFFIITFDSTDFRVCYGTGTFLCIKHWQKFQDPFLLISYRNLQWHLPLSLVCEKQKRNVMIFLNDV